jgi:hypothetical protein
MLDIATSATARYTVERVTYNTVDWAEAESTRVQANSAWSAKSRYRPPPLIRCPLVFSIGRLAIAIDPQHRAVHVQNPVRRIVKYTAGAGAESIARCTGHPNAPR